MMTSQPEHATEPNSCLEELRISIEHALVQVLGEAKLRVRFSDLERNAAGHLQRTHDRLRAHTRKALVRRCREEQHLRIVGKELEGAREMRRLDVPDPRHIRTARQIPAPHEIVRSGIGCHLEAVPGLGRAYAIQQATAHVPVADQTLQPDLLPVVHEQRETTRPWACIGTGAATGHGGQDGDIGVE